MSALDIEKDLLDDDGENRAVRSFLMQYSCDRSVTVSWMRAHMQLCGWDGCWPEWVGKFRAESHLTKAGAQDWLRHLFALEGKRAAQPAVAGGDAIAKSKRILALVDEYVHHQTADTRTALRQALFDEFSVSGQGGEDARDAARYRYTRTECAVTVRGEIYAHAKNIDAAIDAAIAAKESKPCG